MLLSTSTGIGCVTCRFGKSNCQHVQKMVSTTDAASDEGILVPFAAAKNRTKKKKMVIKETGTGNNNY